MMIGNDDDDKELITIGKYSMTKQTFYLPAKKQSVAFKIITIKEAAKNKYLH